MASLLSTAPMSRPAAAGRPPASGWLLLPLLRLASVICIWSSLVSPAAGFCPAGCECFDKPILRATCANLDDVPIQMNPELKVIDLSLNQITHVNYTFAFYMQLQLLNLTHNKIGILGSNNFQYQSELRVLDLSTNSLKQLSKDAFRGLGKARRLLLNDNQIQSIHHRALPDLASLVELNLANNYITHLAPGTLEALTSLRVLVLENNQLLDVPGEGNLQFLPRLVFLNLRSNLVKELKNQSFTGLQNLGYLHLGANDINQVEEGAFAPLASLKWLDMSDNNLTMLPSHQLSKLGNLTNLSLGGNTFVQVPPVAFSGLQNLRELRLDRLMNLTTIGSRALAENPRLRILSLANNPKLDQLPVRLFHGDASQLDVSLQDNAFTTLDAAQLPIDRLRRIRLSGNPFVCNCSLAWLWRLIDADTATGASSQSQKSRSNLSGLESGPSAPFTAAQLRSDVDEAFESGDNAWTEAFITTATTWDWAVQRGPRGAEDKLVVEDMHRITCDLVLNADGKTRARKRFIDLQEAQVQCATSVLYTVAIVILLVLAVITSVFVWLCRKRHLERLLAKHEGDRPIDPWPMDHIEKFEIARDMDRLEYEIRQLDFQNRQLPSAPPQMPFCPHRNWNTPTIRSSNHYSSSQTPMNNHEYQEPVLLVIPGEVPPPLPPRPTLPRVHKYETPTMVVTAGNNRESPTLPATMGRFQRGGGGPNASLSPASQNKYSRTLQSAASPGKQFPRRTAAPFHAEDFEHDGDDESNGLEDDS